jgi:polysaccharide pyruvyl transferase CsaB
VRLLISGYYGAGNLGDEALLAGLLAALGAAGVEPTVASLDPAATRRDHGVAAVHRVRGIAGGLLRADAVLSGGGGLLQDVTSARSLGYYLAVIRAARWLGRPVAVFAQSLGPLSPRGEARVRRALRGVPLGLRDAPSLRLAARLGLDARAVADTALLNPRPTPPGAAAGALVLVPRSGYPTIGDLLAGVGRRHLAAGGRVVIALVHRAQDDAEGARLAAALPAAERIDAATAGELTRGLAGAHAVVSGRLHGLVLGAVAGAPVAGVAYDPKVEGFAQAIGAPVVAAPRPADAEGAAAALATLERFVGAPRLDEAAVARSIERAEAGVRWLLQQALQRPGQATP